jgi:hypothetical protein
MKLMNTYVTSLPGLERLLFVLVILGKNRKNGRRLNPRPNPSIYNQCVINTPLCHIQSNSLFFFVFVFVSIC